MRGTWKSSFWRISKIGGKKRIKKIHPTCKPRKSAHCGKKEKKEKKREGTLFGIARDDELGTIHTPSSVFRLNQQVNHLT